MKKIKKIIHVLLYERGKIGLLLLPKLGKPLSDKTYVKWYYRYSMGKKLNLKNPKTFTEKLQWLKVYDHNPLYTTLVDKYAVKPWVAERIGEQYIIPTLGVWDSFDEIDFDKLPNQFVLKTTHGGGSVGVVICKDKTCFNKEEAKSRLEHSMKISGYEKHREWPYKNVPRRIIAEKFINPAPNTKDLPDYKWYCFRGEPLYCQVIQDRTTNKSIDFFDTNWVHQEFVGLLPVSGSTIESAKYTPKRPQDLEVQIKIARELAKDLPFSRIDLYSIGEKTYFGEITFYPASGLGTFKPEQYNDLLGKILVLPSEKRGGVIIKQLEGDKFEIKQPDLPDYKFFCFNGEPKYCQVVSGRNVKKCLDFFDKDWNHQPFREPSMFPNAEVMPLKPKCLDEMWNLAAKLAEGKAFTRIDFYEVNGQVLFGEVTFFPTSGLGSFEPKEYDAILGKMIHLPID